MSSVNQIAEDIDSPIPAWALRAVSAEPTESWFPADLTQPNTVLNRRRLANWLYHFDADCDVKNFLLLDALGSWLQLPLSCTGVIDNQSTLASRPFRLWEYAWLYKTLSLHRGGYRILDIGGPSTHLTALAALSGNEVHSIDINPTFIAAGEDLAHSLKLHNLHGSVDDGRDLSRFADHSFDVVVCCSVLEHLTAEGQQSTLKEIARVLAPSGMVGLTFDYGPSAAGVNEHLPPPHEPPDNAIEILRRYEVAGLHIIGNRDLEEPIVNSLFVSDTVQYTVASLFLGGPLRESSLTAPVCERQARPIIDTALLLGVGDAEADSWLQLAREQYSPADIAEALPHIEMAGLGAHAMVFQQQVALYRNEFTRWKDLATHHEAAAAAAQAALPVRDNEIARWRDLATYYQGELASANTAIQDHERESAHWKTLADSHEHDIAQLTERATEQSNILEGLTRERAQLHEDTVKVQREADGLRTALAYGCSYINGLQQQHLALAARLEQEQQLSAQNKEEAYLYARTLDRLDAEHILVVGFRKWLKRMPASRNRFEVIRVPRIVSLEAVLASVHRLVTLWVEGRVAARVGTPVQWPRITVVTPCYNSESYIANAIESVLNQHYPNLEHFIEDGGSTDGTLAIVSRYKNRLAGVFSQKDNGMYDAIGRGFDRGTGDILCYLNSDDVFLPGALYRVGEYFARHPKADVIYHSDIVDVNGWRYPNVAQRWVGFSELLNGHILFQDGVFFRRRAYQAAGGINRKLKLAGDWDLWTRMAKKSSLQLLPGHVSCFSYRPGQLSSQMDKYEAEMEQRKPEIRSSASPLLRFREAVLTVIRRVRNAMGKYSGQNRLLFPIDFSQMPPPPGELPDMTVPISACPITGSAPDRLLFSSRDTRFGHPLINYVYYVPKSHLTICHPPVSQEFLADLYQRYYSQSAPAVILPDPRYGSPYRLWRGPGLLLRFVRNILAPLRLTEEIKLTWEETTPVELLEVARRHGFTATQPLAFLDVGCFEGTLLDTLTHQTSWVLTGVEPNPVAAEVAREKGHSIVVATAMEAVLELPTEQQYDIVFLGQVIEHLDTPKLVLQRLACLLKPGGILVISTPNLDSGQIDLFGPAWSHWHPPYHRFVFSPRALRLLAKKAGLTCRSCHTYSHPYWTALSLQLNNMGLGGAVPHDIQFPPHIGNHSRSIATWSRLFWDWRGKGDYMFAAFSRES